MIIYYRRRIRKIDSNYNIASTDFQRIYILYPVHFIITVRVVVKLCNEYDMTSV